MYSYPYNSPSKIKAVLSAYDAAARKRWGQNFLVDPNHARIIAENILKYCGAEITEIGPGLGAITSILLKEGRVVRGVEIDPVMGKILDEQLTPEFPGFSLSIMDVLDFLAERPPIESICGNLPYYISTDIFRGCMKIPGLKTAVFLTQYEFSQRVAVSAAPLNSLAVYLQNFGEWKKLHTVPESAFYPVPKVRSALILFQRHPDGFRSDPGILEQLLRMSFGGKRKMMLNSWKKASPQPLEIERLISAAEGAGVDHSRRAEELSPADFYRMANLLLT